MTLITQSNQFLNHLWHSSLSQTSFWITYDTLHSVKPVSESLMTLFTQSNQFLNHLWHSTLSETNQSVLTETLIFFPWNKRSHKHSSHVTCNNVALQTPPQSLENFPASRPPILLDFRAQWLMPHEGACSQIGMKTDDHDNKGRGGHTGKAGTSFP